MSQAQANQLTISGVLNPQATETELHFADGTILRLPTALLSQTAPRESGTGSTDEPDQILIPVVEEQLEVTKRVVETGKVYLHKSVAKYDVKLDEPLAVEQWRIERIAKNEVISETPLTRREGEATVYPVVEERLVLTKELVLVEEIHVTRAVSERRDVRTIVLRRESMDIERKNLLNPPS